MPQLTKHLLSNFQAGLSTALEPDVNQPFKLQADYEGIECDQMVPTVPVLEQITGEDQVGSGAEGPHNPRNYRWTGTAVTIGCKLNNHYPRRLIKRFLAGPLVNTPVATGVWDHFVKMQDRFSTVPQLSTFAGFLGGADFIYSSMAVNTITCGQNVSDEPVISFEMLGSGHHIRFREVYKAQKVTVVGTGGTFKLSFMGQPTANIAFDANAATVLAALEALSNVAPGDLSATGTLAAGMTITVLPTGNWGEALVDPMTADAALLTGPGAGVTIEPTEPYLVLPQPPSYEKMYMHGSALSVVLNNGQVQSLNDFGILTHQIRMTQNIEWKYLPGKDQFMVPGIPESGAFMGDVARGNRQVEASFKLYLDSKVDEYYWSRKNLSITDVIVKYEGSRIGNTTFNQAVEFTIPLSKPRPLVIDTDNQYAAKTLSLLPMWVDTRGFIEARIRDGNATLV